ncbi:MAG: acyl-homoserine-lactone synthase [Sphingomonadaceae bacterium]
MVYVIDHRNRKREQDKLLAMHADRKAVFVDRLKWNVPVIDDRYEMDEFDNEHAIYLVAADPGTGMHLGSVRLLPTTRRHIVGDIFGILIEGEVPRGADVYEVTRLCTSPQLADWEAHNAVRERLATALVEFALTAGITRYTMMTHTAYLSQLLALGWDVEPLGLPKEIGGQMLGALQVNVKPETLSLFRAKFALPEQVLRLDLSE